MSLPDEQQPTTPDPRRRSGRGRGRGRGRNPARTQDGPRERGQDRTHPRADASRERRAEVRRAVVVPPITYPEQLPVSARRAEIAAAIRDHQVVIVAGETGSGKTTQLPKIALELGRGRDGQIGHTQPRRIAARTVAERIAEEVSGSSKALGGVVGYQVRFTDTSSEETLVKVMTDGILLAQIQRDPLLLAYDTLIVDEAHERSLNIDFILGYLTRLLPRRPDLKVVITSATIDSERFARHFAGPPTPEEPDGVPAPVVEVSGRTYPVELRYRPLSPDATGTGPDDTDDALATRPTGRQARAREDRDLMTGICEAVDELAAEGPGDVLVFLSGEREIRDAEDALRSHLGPRVSNLRRPDVEILPLYARLSSAEQHRVFEPHGTRRVVLATNVAETSLTVPGVRYVVDPGTARISRWSKATKVQRLPIEPISQASAAQRAGRCGRVADGVAIRLYSEEDLASRPEFTEPEILRTSLASVILQMVAVGVAATPDDVTRFPFVDPPDVRSVRDGVQLLTELGALESATSETGRGSAASGGTVLTDIGRGVAQLPMDPRLARMILEGGRRGVAREVMIVAAALSIQDPRERPVEQRPQADQAHARFADPTSDFLTYLNLWHYLRDRQRELSGSAFRRLCRAEHLNYLRIREWQDVVTQLREMAKPLGIRVAPPRPASEPDPDRPEHDQRQTWDTDPIHLSLLSGLLSHVGMQEGTEVRVSVARGKQPAASGRGDRRSRNEYLGARGARFAIFPGSPLSKRPPAWVMAGELVETSRLWGRDAARISPEWAEEVGAHLVKRTYSEPSWSSKQGAAMAFEKVLLYGLPVVQQRRVLYAKVDPAHARELFLRHALVEGDWTTHHRFFHDNRRLLAEAEAVEAKARRRDLVVDDDALFDFYDERVPDDVVSARNFDQWWKDARRSQPDLLTFTLDLLLPDAAGVADETRFPSTWPQGDLELPLTYQFEPGADADGVTVHVPVVVLGRVQPEGFDWMVPGLRDELLTALVRSLPKPVRVQLVPAPDVARDVGAWFDDHLASWHDTVRAGDAAPSVRDAFAQAVRELRGVEIGPDDWDEDRLPAHLRMTFRVHDDRRGAPVVLDESKDLVALQRRLAARTEDALRVAVRSAVRDAARERPEPGAAEGGARAAAEAPAAADPRATLGADVERSGLRTWPDDLPELPERIEATGPGGHLVRAYPSLVDEGGSVAVRMQPDAVTQSVRHRLGLRRLLVLDLGLATPRVTSRWSGTQALTLAASPYRSTDALVLDVQLAAIDALLDEHLAGAPATVVRDAARYAAARAWVRDRLEDRVHAVVVDVVGVLTAARDLDAAVRASTSLALLATLQDVREDAARLVDDGFVARTGATRLPHLVRYLRAAQHRIGKAAENPQRDAELAWRVHELEQELDRARARAASARPEPARDAALTDVGWLLEELRVSLFAQHLGTAVPVSEKRVRAALAP